MTFIFVFFSKPIIAVIFDASKNSPILTVYFERNKIYIKKWPILRHFYTFSLHADINFIFLKFCYISVFICYISVDVPQIMLSGKNVISEKGKFPQSQKWKETSFCEQINFGVSFIIPELNICPYYSKNKFRFSEIQKVIQKVLRLLKSLWEWSLTLL